MYRALIVTYNKTPNGDAGAVRQMVFAKMLQELGYNVLVVGMGASTLETDDSMEYEGIPCKSLRNSDTSFLSKLDNYFGYKCKLSKILEQEDIFNLILVVDLPINAMRLIERYAKKNNTVIIHDSVEWYSPEEFKYGKFSSEYLRKDYRNRFFFRKPWRVVAISSYLENHFKNKNLATCRIPVIMDMKGYRFEKKCNQEKICIVYAGAPGKKDCFDQIIIAIKNLPEEIRKQFELIIIGVDDSFLIKNLKLSNEEWNQLRDTIKCLGRIPRGKVLEHLKSADYTILMRQSELRYAKAGFSTKVPESLLTGTPVICNISSDLALYLVDGENSIIASDNTAKAIENALIRAINIPAESRKEMQIEANNTAKRYFDYRLYINVFASLISMEGNDV